MSRFFGKVQYFPEELQHKIEEMNKVKDFSLYIEL